MKPLSFAPRRRIPPVWSALLLAGSALHLGCGTRADADASAPDATADGALPDGTSPDALPGDGPLPDSSTTDSASGTCTPDPTLLASRRACLADDQCPCGAHCELGVCVASCGAGLPACDGGVCDRFGRCRAAGDTRLHPAESTRAATPALHLDERLELASGTAEQPVYLQAPEGPVGRVRVVVTAPFQVRCDAAGAYDSECSLPSLAAQGEATLRVRVAPGTVLPLAAPGMLRAYWGSAVLSRGLTVASSSGALTAAELEGSYTGTATLLNAGTTAGQQAALASLAMPLTAQIVGGRISLVDPMRVFVPTQDGRLVGSLTLDATGATAAVSFNPQRAWQSSLTASDTVNVVVQPQLATATLNVGGPTVTFDLTYRYPGYARGTTPLETRWRVVLGRSGAAVDSLLQLTPGVIVPAANYPNARGSWETALLNVLSGGTMTNATEAADLLRTVWGGAAASPLRLDLCARPLSNTDPALQLVSNDRWATWSVRDVGLAGRPATATATFSSISNLPSNAIPCDVTFTPSGAPCAGTAASVRVDHCAELAADLGCSIVASSGHIDPLVYVHPTSTTTCISTFSGIVARSCVAPATPAPLHCGELVSCYAGDGYRTSALLSGAAGALAVSSDRRCALAPAGGTQTAGLALDVLRASSAAGTPTVDQALRLCASDLGDLRAPPPSVTRDAAGLAALFGSSQCVNAGQLVAALGMTASQILGPTPAPTADGLRERRYFVHLLETWLRLQSMFASEAQQRSELPPVITGDLPAEQQPGAWLERSLDAWPVLFFPQFRSALLALGDAALSSDYQLGFGATSSTAPGLPVVLLEAYATQLAAAYALVSSDTAGDPEVDRAARFARLAPLLDATASDLYAMAQAAAARAGAPIAWDRRYQLSRDRVRTLLLQLGQRARLLAAYGNLQSLGPHDVPLYFLGTSADPRQRFSAISDYLLGSTPGAGAWASSAVLTARNALAGAQSEWNAQLARQYRAQSTAARLADVRHSYGSTVADFCGVPAGFTTDTLLERWEGNAQPRFRARSCYVVTPAQDPSCTPPLLPMPFNADDVRRQVLLAVRLNAELGGTAGFADPAMQALTVERNYALYGAPTYCTSSDSTICLTVGTHSYRFPAAALGGLVGLDRWTPAHRAEILADATSRFPTAHNPLPEPAHRGPDPFASGRCYRGTGGELALAVRAATTEVAIARSELDNQYEHYRVARQSCNILAQSAAQQRALNQDFEAGMTILAVTAVALDGVANVCDAVAACSYSISQADGIATAGSGGANLIADVVGCGADAASAAAATGASAARETMAAFQRHHDDAVAQLATDTAVRQCFNDARQYLVGADTQRLRIERALEEMTSAEYRLQQAALTTQQAWTEGHQQLSYALANQYRAPDSDPWLSPAVENFRTSMRSARRVLFLAGRALEYEYQLSLPQTRQALTAQTPDELQQLLTALSTSAAPRQLNGHAPSGLTGVVSLRDHLRQLASHAALSDAEQRLSPTERFRLLLQSPEYAVFDAAGAYQGQRIPFSVVPLSALGTGAPTGIALFSSSDCAERVWTVNASVLGAGQLYRGSATTNVRLDLLKSNSFYSQWCGVPPNARTPYQFETVNPSRNLFRDPFTDSAAFGASSFGLSRVGETFTRARIQAFLNVPQSMLEMPSYSNGETAELAARGLFGEYALFLPASTLSQRQPDGSFSDGLVLDNVDDILLRIDYVSVAR